MKDALAEGQIVIQAVKGVEMVAMDRLELSTSEGGASDAAGS